MVRAMRGWIFLSGMMGSGKSSVGRVLARSLGQPFVDLDARIVDRVGRSIADFFAAEGEAAFRALEAEEARQLIEAGQPAVVALGGGTVTRAATRRLLLRAGALVTLTAPASELARRLSGTDDRPLLARGAGRVLEELLEERADAYAECHGTVQTGGRTVDAVAQAVRSIVDAAPIPVPLGGRTYRVHVGSGLRAELPARLDGPLVLVTDENVDAAWAGTIREQLGARVSASVVLPPGEEHKTIRSVERIWDAALETGADRGATVLSVGGGVVGDMAGFAASTLLRGVAFAQVPTTLLAMVDASVGGKTGFDRRQGKNLVGSFHQPRFVLCDVDTLMTLPDADLRSGIAEVVKSAWLDSEAAVAAVERDVDAIVARDPAALIGAVRRSVALKADVVSEDEQESGRRMILNLGHTLGHAIEAAHGFVGIRHGEAVALGMMAAMRVAHALGDEGAQAHAHRLEALLVRAGLPHQLDPYLDARTLSFVGADKKRAGGKVRFVVPHGPGHQEIVPLGLEALRRILLPA